ncbi:hypothetical protein KSF81_17960 [Siccirubricoccus sp. G192]|nr:hypothetical protein [Siccirubricoccus sp. G192]
MTPPAPLEGLACLVLAHDDAPQLALLLQRLSDDGAACYLHLDARARAVRQALLPGLPPGVWLAPEAESRRIAWGGFGMIEASLLLLRQALRNPATQHVCLLSGTHLPVQPAARIAAFLFDGRQHIDLRLAAAEPPERESLRRFWHPGLPGREQHSRLRRSVNRNAWLLGRRDLARGLRGLTPMVGSQWWHMTADCACEMLRFLDANPWYTTFFHRVRIPDESFFQTLLGGSRHAEQVGEPLFLAADGGFQSGRDRSARPGRGAGQPAALRPEVRPADPTGRGARRARRGGRGAAFGASPSARRPFPDRPTASTTVGRDPGPDGHAERGVAPAGRAAASAGTRRRSHDPGGQPIER